MPGRRRSKKAQPRPSGTPKGRTRDTAMIPFSCVLTIQNAAASGNVVLNPVNFGTLLAAIADEFTLFRFRRIRFGLMINSASDAAIGYKAGSTTAAGPTTLSTVFQLSRSAYNWSDQTTPSHLLLTERDLLGQAAMNWYKVDVGTDADTQGEQQGTLYSASGATTTLNLTCVGMIEFCGKIDPSSNPSLLATRLIRSAVEGGPGSAAYEEAMGLVGRLEKVCRPSPPLGTCGSCLGCQGALPPKET